VQWEKGKVIYFTGIVFKPGILLSTGPKEPFLEQLQWDEDSLLRYAERSHLGRFGGGSVWQRFAYKKASR
jgi:hypothetical protein